MCTVFTIVAEILSLLVRSTSDTQHCHLVIQRRRRRLVLHLRSTWDLHNGAPACLLMLMMTCDCILPQSLLSSPPSPPSHAHLFHSVTTCCDFLARLFSCDNNFINVFYRSLFIRYHFPQHLKFWKLFFAIVQLFHVLISLSLLLCCNSIILCLFSLCMIIDVLCSMQ